MSENLENAGRWTAKDAKERKSAMKNIQATGIHLFVMLALLLLGGRAFGQR